MVFDPSGGPPPLLISPPAGILGERPREIQGRRPARPTRYGAAALERLCTERQIFVNYANIKYCDIANGEGVRTSLFVSGCRRHCKDCFNAVAWDFCYGQPFDKAARNAILGSLAPEYIDGLSLLGGEPFEPENQRALVPFLHDVRVLYPHKTIWCYTGNHYERELLQPSPARCEVTDEMLSLLDVLVDGEFLTDEKDITLRFRGSSNQRIIDLNKTRAAGHTVLWQDDPIFADHRM